MEIEYKGAHCLTIKLPQATVVIDPKLSLVGLKDVTITDMIELVTDEQFIVKANEKILIESPGEYEVANVSIKGVAAKRHRDESGKKVTMYQISSGGTRVGIVGHISDDLSEDQLEQLGLIDILIVPVGGSGYTLDAHSAAKLVGRISPKVVIPVHYADKGIKYEVAQNELDLFLKEVGATQHEALDKFKLKTGAALPEILTVVELNRT